MTDAPVLLDCRGLLCPLPVLKSRKKLRDMASGQILVVRSTDPMAVIDIPHMCNEDGHRLVSQEAEADVMVFTIARAAVAPTS
jgi:tRNA 2-thiouridine synthesizing protein A